MENRLSPDYWRQRDLYEPSNDRNAVLIVGAGSLGSYLAFGLCRMGVRNITITDFDKVEAYNLPNQFFAESLAQPDIYKVLMLKKTLDFMMPNNTLQTLNDDIQTSEDLHRRTYNVIFVAVDSMRVRKWIWDHYKGKEVTIIDGRIGGEFANVYCIKTNDSHAWQYYDADIEANTDESIDKVAPLPCTATAVVDVAMAVSAEMIGRYRHLVKGNIQNMHSFHDYKIGRSEIFQAYPKYAESKDLMAVDQITRAGTEPEKEELPAIMQEIQNQPPVSRIPTTLDELGTEFPVIG